MKYYLAMAGVIGPMIDDYLKKPVENRFLNKESYVPELKDFLLQEERTFLESLKEIIEVSSFWGIVTIDVDKKSLDKSMNTLLNPLTYTGDLDDFRKAIEFIKAIFEEAEKEIHERIALLNEQESTRLGEAFNCYVNELNYSTIVMSVSAIESKLFSLMMSTHNDKKLEDLTLGQLIREYTDNKEKYGNVIPKKHEALLDYCNTYRVFSVHPKKEKINRANATTILCMTCSFLFDKNMKIPPEEKKA
jgi:hypothetical protein